MLLWGLKAFYLCNYLSIWDCLRVSTLKKEGVGLVNNALRYLPFKSLILLSSVYFISFLYYVHRGYCS